ncbi:alpha/beta fold hydrolase [Listeria costaricensis]|uniref:alpha/beta fold hydrolase n=1 Tax=Listeria costaricensis TaxID=2026604 RepID=UPI000C071CCA|nr:alpha/beta fold hydrolase [Listeria costaricensis]
MLKRLIFAGLVPLLCVVGAIYCIFQMEPQVKAVSSSNIPTIFIHGYRGTDRSLHGMIRRFDQKYDWGTDALKVSVSPTGEISTTGSYSKTAKNPLINIVFEDNRATITQQSMWTKKVMLYLQDHYDIRQFNAVGHSMGGGAWVAYLASYEKNPDYPQVNKIVFLAVPFYPEEYVNGDEEVDIKNANEVHAKFASQMSKNLPENVKILIIGGNLDDGSDSDGEVKIDSVLYGKKLFTKQEVETHVIHGPEATHSNMHELTAVDKYVGPFLFGQK